MAVGSVSSGAAYNQEGRNWSFLVTPRIVEGKRRNMDKTIAEYNNKQTGTNQEICLLLSQEIDQGLPEVESKVWHGHPVWFLAGNPIVGYAVLKDSVQLLFWSGQSFDEPELQVEGTFKAAQIRYTAVDQINTSDLKRWLEKAEKIQWDYKSLVKRRGELIRLK